MYPNSVKLCNKECFRMLSLDAGAMNEESIGELIHSFLALEHEADMKRIDQLMEMIQHTQDLAGWELCSCDSHICSLAVGSHCMANTVDHHFWEIHDAELATVDQEHIYLKLPME